MTQLLNGVIFTHRKPYKPFGCLSECACEMRGEWARYLCFVLWAELKMLTELEIMSQEGWLCETKFQEESCWNTQIVQGVCEASCLGPWLCVFHRKHTYRVRLMFSCTVSALALRIELSWDVKVFLVDRIESSILFDGYNNVFYTRCPTVFLVCVCGAQ